MMVKFLKMIQQNTEKFKESIINPDTLKSNAEIFQYKSRCQIFMKSVESYSTTVNDNLNLKNRKL